MGSITARKGADGKVNYRAAIRINRMGFPTFSESKTFHSKGGVSKSMLIIF